jgi:hypothetical protein
MFRYLTILSLAVILLAAACGPALPSAPILPTFLPSMATEPVATAEINEAYPTAQASESGGSQSASGFNVRLDRAWRDGKQVYADVCFTVPDASDWTIWAAHFDYGSESVAEFSTSMVSQTDATGGQAAERCDEISFYVPPDADLSSATLTVESVGAYPTGDEYCSLYMPKIQQSLQEKGIGITLECSDVGGVMTMQITSKPDNMSQEQAEQLVFSDEFYTVKGPWSFPVTFEQ